MSLPRTFSEATALFTGAFDRWNDHNAPRLGAALAFYTLFSLAPLMITSAMLLAAVFGTSEATTEITTQVRLWVGDNAANAIAALIASNQQPSGIFSRVILFSALFFGASGIFIELRNSLNEMWEAHVCRVGFLSGLLRQRAFAFAMVCGTGLFLVVSTGASLVLTVMGRFVGNYLGASPKLLEAVNFGLSVTIVAILFALIFRLVPDVRLKWEPILVGAGVTTVLFTIGRAVLDLYLAASNVGSMYGAAGSLIVIVVWVYYSAQIFLFGAELTKLYADSCQQSMRADLATPPSHQLPEYGR